MPSAGFASPFETANQRQVQIFRKIKIEVKTRWWLPGSRPGLPSLRREEMG
jgi:hypothetical protein